ncbi:peroxide stress protein YaaA [Shewanella sp. C32]|uniref:UPF0246 protein L9G74_08085 n=1 Tax=Shewanella electrica TaxID=515560 RepID=A0ABT2FJ84_9GAMM|nr:peroxide stress protein YaaA [Shewanella electrica]MCH1924492.1 peroxide stress protein YaaA [Shewanella electrica]MCS4556393.1 peroxide stress protein YaaA [Shewanella electrica]
MLILISPAKTLDFETPAPVAEYSLPMFLDDSQVLIDVCRQLTPVQIAKLMSVSDKIAGLNAARFASWQQPFTLGNAKQALFAFKGDVYTGLDAESLPAALVLRAQKRLRMLSGLYGLLKPLDLMQPYRLEMGTQLENPRGKNLYEFWGSEITNAINHALPKDEPELIVNLASNEYFKAVKPKLLNGNLVAPVFKDCKNGQYKIISFYAKKARGMMARWILEHDITDAEQLKQFDVAGYYYSAEQSTPQAPVFLREEQV